MRAPFEPNTPRTANSIAFLRAALAAMVIFTHSHLLGGFPAESFANWTGGVMSLGTLAVQCFFVLSGSLVALSWLRLKSAPVFLWHRFLRLAPAFWVCLAFTALVLGPIVYAGSSPKGSYFSLDPSPLRYIWRNLLQPRRQIGIGHLLGGEPWGSDFNGSLWTLFYEGSCYLVVAIAGVAGLLARRGMWFALWGAALLLFTIAVTGHAVHLSTRLFDTPGKLLSLDFASGVTWALLPEAGLVQMNRPWIPLLSAALLAASWRFGSSALVTAVALPPVFFWLVEILPLRGWESWVGGDYSYGLYIYGYPVQQTLAHFGFHRLGFGAFFGIGLAATAIMAWCSWHYVEKSALRLKSRLFSPKAERASA